MVLSALLMFVYPPLPSAFVTAMTVIGGLSMIILALLEILGENLKYSKFGNVSSSPTVPSRAGMLVLYAPAFLAGAASFWIFPSGGISFLFLRSALTIHFLKRILEVLFVHKFGGSMAVDSMLIISVGYFVPTSTMIYAHHLSERLPPPGLDLTYPGIALFLIGITGNFYRHVLLAKLRKKGDREYRIPEGGLFGLVICPHYLFEIIDFVGMSFISQTLYAFSVAAGIIVYLIGRSYATRRWYLSKFEDFPKAVRAVIPFIF